MGLIDWIIVGVFFVVFAFLAIIIALLRAWMKSLDEPSDGPPSDAYSARSYNRNPSAMH